MKTPPLPPGGRFFKLYKGKSPMFRQPGTGLIMWLDSPIIYGWKFIIAAVAIEQFNELAFKLEKKCCDEDRVHLRYGLEDEPEPSDPTAEIPVFGFRVHPASLCQKKT